MRDVWFSYEPGKPVLSGISLDICKNKKTVFLGPNGSGKSTLFLHFNGVHKPDRGQVLFGNAPIKYDQASLAKLRSEVALVFQNPDDQIFLATVEEDVAFGPMNLGLGRDEVEERVAQALDLVGISSLRERPTQQLSFGQRKRVALAGAIAMKPKVLIMDEPTAGLDPQMVHELLELSDELVKNGTTVVISTHDVETAYEWADEIHAIYAGKLMFSGEPEEFFEREDKLLHKIGMSPPIVLSLNRSLNDLAGIPLKPYPRTLAEALHKAFGKSKKPGTLYLLCVDEHKNIPKSKLHGLSGVYGAAARKLVLDGKLDVHYHFHALENGLMQAAGGKDFVLYTDSSLCKLVEEKARRLEKNSGVRVNIVHQHEEK